MYSAISLYRAAPKLQLEIFRFPTSINFDYTCSYINCNTIKCLVISSYHFHVHFALLVEPCQSSTVVITFAFMCLSTDSSESPLDMHIASYSSECFRPHLHENKIIRIHHKSGMLWYRIHFAIYTQDDEFGIKRSLLIACPKILNPIRNLNLNEDTFGLV